jgi:hypothetical protein
MNKIYGEEPWNPFDAADDNDRFPPSTEIASSLAVGRGKPPAFDVDARARLAPAFDTAAAAPPLPDLPGCLPPHTSRRLEQLCQSWFDEKLQFKVVRVSRKFGCAVRMVRQTDHQVRR